MRKDADIWSGASGTTLQSQLVYIHCGVWQLSETRKTARDADDQVGLWLIRFLQEIIFPFLWPGVTPAPQLFLWEQGASGLQPVAHRCVWLRVHDSKVGGGVVGTRSHLCYSHSIGEQVKRGWAATCWFLRGKHGQERVWPKRQWHSPSPLVPKWRLSKRVETSTRKWLYLLGFYEAGAWSQRFCCLQSDSKDLSLGPHIYEHTQYAREFIWNL